MTHVRNAVFQLKPGKIADVKKLFTDELLPLMKKVPGFKHEITMTKGDQLVGLTVWVDRQSAEKYQTVTFPTVIAKLNPFLTGAPVIDEYELGVTTLSA